MRIYFDHNATTPVDPAVPEAVVRALVDGVRQRLERSPLRAAAKAVLDDARSAVAALIGGEPSEVVFTSGAPKQTTSRCAAWPRPSNPRAGAT